MIKYKPTHILEMIWLVASIISTVLVAYNAIIQDFTNVKFLGIVAIVSWLMYLLRRQLRKRLSKNG